jgi:site-specific DNA-methyltransferase (adenine-specific)
MEMTYQLHLGDCIDVLATLPDNSVDSIVTDPPYGLSFMGKKWDYDVPSVAIWEQCLRVLKPGGHLLAFAGTRTQHRMAVRIEDAGFEIRDMIAWVYGSGFPKSLDVSKAIDKAAGAEREVIGSYKGASNIGKESTNSYITTESGTATDVFITAPATEAARQWSGWGTALKPALEPITMARKPLSGTVAETVLQHGTGGINVDACRVGTETAGWCCKAGFGEWGSGLTKDQTARPVEGRWPANIIHDGSNEAALALKSGARFFYTAKAGKVDRESENNHPTVKPTMLMAYLCRLVTPPGGTVLDPFMGSGSTGKAATVNGFRFIGIERDPEYHKIAQARISNQHEGRLL